jgi:acetoacetyl-CoA reductase
MARVAVVTGGTRGIGRAISEGLHKAGYKVAANYGGNVDVAKQFTAETGIPAYRFDVCDFAACTDGVKQITADLGPVEVLVNNAGITRDGTLQRMSFEQWNAVIQTNLSSCFNMCRCAIDGMRERGFGRIVNIGSINGQAGQYGQVNYAAAKSGLHGFTKALAQEGASKGITVNAIAPGYFETDMNRAFLRSEVGQALISRIPMGRSGVSSDLDGALLLLASAAGAYITGAVLPVDGGHAVAAV